MTKGGSVAKSKYAMLEAVIRTEPTHIETQKNRGGRSVRKRGTSTKTDESDKRFRAATFSQFEIDDATTRGARGCFNNARERWRPRRRSSSNARDCRPRESTCS